MFRLRVHLPPSAMPERLNRRTTEIDLVALTCSSKSTPSILGRLTASRCKRFQGYSQDRISSNDCPYSFLQVTPHEVSGDVQNYLIYGSQAVRHGFMLDTLIAMDARDVAKDERFVRVFFNNQMFHTPAVALMAYERALLRETFNSSTNLVVVNRPFPRVVEEKVPIFPSFYSTKRRVCLLSLFCGVRRIVNIYSFINFFNYTKYLSFNQEGCELQKINKIERAWQSCVKTSTN